MVCKNRGHGEFIHSFSKLHFPQNVLYMYISPFLNCCFVNFVIVNIDIQKYSYGILTWH